MKSDRTPLAQAIQDNNPDAAHRLLETGADPNTTTNDLGTTVLHHASGLDDPAILKDLIAHGANPDAQTRKGFTPLNNAASKNNPTTITALLDAGATIDLPDDQGNTPLMAAVYHGQADATRTLLDRGANPDLVNRRGACAQDFLANHEGPRRSELERAFLDHAARREEPEVQAKRRRM